MSGRTFCAKVESVSVSIRAADLLALLHASQGARTRSVVIEAARPAVGAPSHLGRKAVSSAREMLPPPAATLIKRRPKKAGTTGSCVSPAAMRSIAQTLKRLGLDSLARRNDLNGSFVVEATAHRIRELAAAPGVQAVRANRRHRNPASQAC